MNEVLRPYLENFVVVYLEDICIYSKSHAEHLQHVDLVLQALQDNELHINPEKSHIGMTEIKFLGHVISPNNISPDPAKITAVQEWPCPRTVRDIRAFLGLTGYYRRFIQNYAHKALPLTNLTKDKTPWQ
jgi:hypothetical protein